MGHEIEKILTARGHSIVLIVDENNRNELNIQNLSSCGADVAIEFTTPQTAFGNIEVCMRAGVAVVCGTTGWLERFDEAVALCGQTGGALFYASNFSIGVNIFFSINRILARMMDGFPEYRPAMKEVHHIHKKDAPSGTAITLAEGIVENVERIGGWKLGATVGEDELGIVAERVGEVPGTHSVEWGSAADTITITHEAKNRTGFATGAVLAAEYLCGKTGVHSMEDLLGL